MEKPPLKPPQKHAGACWFETRTQPRARMPAAMCFFTSASLPKCEGTALAGTLAEIAFQPGIVTCPTASKAARRNRSDQVRDSGWATFFAAPLPRSMKVVCLIPAARPARRAEAAQTFPKRIRCPNATDLGISRFCGTIQAETVRAVQLVGCPGSAKAAVTKRCYRC